MLSGTSTVAGTFNFTVSATDSSSGAGAPFSGSRAYSLTVGAPSVVVAPATLPNPTVGAAYSQTVTASGGTAPYTFAVTAGATPSGLSLSAAGVLSGTPTAAGMFNFTVTATDGNGFDGVRAYTVTAGGPTLVLTPTSQPTGHVGQAYTTSYSTTGGTAPYHYTVTGNLPTGLSLADNGTLSGTPTQAGNFPVAIHVTDSSTGAGSPFTATVNMTLAVDADPLVLTPASPALTATYGVSNSITFTSSGGSAPRTLSLTGALPAGMSFDPASGVLSGTPTVTGSFPFTVTVTDGSLTPATLSRNYTLTIATVTVVVSPATLPGGVVGTAYSGSLSASGGAAPYTFAVSTGALPEGITLSPAGALSGTPTRSGAVSFTVRAADAHGMAGTQAYSVTIGDAVPVAVADTASTAANQAVTIPVTANDTGVITSVAVAAAPTHGTAVADGTSVRYTPATDFFGTDTFTYTAIGPGGRSHAATVTVNVQAGALPVVPDQAVTGVAGQAINVNATQGASGGPFTAVTLVTPPAAGTATVNGTTISYTAPADASGTQRFTYTLTNVFGVSQPATVTVTVQPRPVAVALTATVGAGQSVQVDLTGAARGGPFTDAAVVSLSPAQSGAATIVKTATGYRLDFAAAAAFSGQAQLVYTLSNAYAVSQPATVTITVTARPDPSRDPEVTGILGAQVDATRRMATGQISNFQQRLESLHGAASSRFSNGLSFSSGGGRNAVQSERPGKGVAESMNDPDAPAFLQSDARPAPTQSGGQASPDDVSFWTGGAVNFGATDRGTASNGVDFTTSGVSVGADKRLSNALTLGLGVGYGHDASDIGKMGSRSTTTAYNMALYASLRPSDSTYVDTLLGYQWLDFDARRYVTADGGRVTGSRNGRQAFASVAFGYEHDDGTTRLTPYGRLDVARAQLDGYTERGDATYALDYRGQTVRTSTGALGLRAEFRLKRDFGTLVPRVRVEYQRDFQGASNAKMSYADLLAGPLYRANVGDTARNHTLLGLGVQAQFDSGLTLRAEYQALFDSGTHANQSILLGIEKAF
ncbi:MAG: autotransporter domain-containing protein [Luteibacter sp.]|uniref:autotransporter domain-containing protein n=1 Tax=Luteibacter sp. TaxID=1886636 RepID=UPI002807B953|nr:autotransporter domain-containing protein [Luteibacter sp.]MDQ7996381.1 autotransporter domain-containing protein [Luteibacter sp.]